MRVDDSTISGLGGRDGDEHFSVNLVFAVVMDEDTTEEGSTRTGDTDDEECARCRDGGVDAILDTAEDSHELYV